MGKIHRLPFRLRHVQDKQTLRDWRDFELCESNNLPAWWENVPNWREAFPLDISVELADALTFNGVCSYCRAAIDDLTKPCACGVAHDKQITNRVSLPSDEYMAVVFPIYNREQRSAAHLRRRKALKENGGHYIRADIDDLLRLQIGRCWFCGDNLLSDAGLPAFHVEHYDPVSEGGRNDVFNIVLACAQCNLRKGTMHGDEFEFLMRKARSKALSRRIWSFRVDVEIYLDGRPDAPAEITWVRS